MAEKKQDERTRNWTFVAYPDSVPSDWLERLNDQHIEFCVSPLHDKDINADNTPKKAHWHILITFSGNKSYQQVKELADSINATIPQKIHSLKGAIRYLTHMDNPEKAQYKIDDIKTFGGFDLSLGLKPTSSERYKFISEMIDYCENNNITEFCDLMIFARSEHFDDWFPLLCDNSAYVIGQYIKSLRHKKKGKYLLVDETTGEVI